jgi:hypothetical protein
MRHYNAITVCDYDKQAAGKTHARMMMQVVIVGGNNGGNCKGLRTGL